MVSQRPYCPLTDRRKIGDIAEPFSENFWKYLYAPRFVRLILLYVQNRPDRKNMAIMQDWPVLTWEIAKMQGGIKPRQAQFDLGTDQNETVSLWFNCLRSERQIAVLILSPGLKLKIFSFKTILQKIAKYNLLNLGELSSLTLSVLLEPSAGGQNVRHQQKEVAAYFAATLAATWSAKYTSRQR